MSNADGNEIPFGQGFISDHRSQKCEPFQPPYRFLRTGVKPEVGQRTEAHFNSPSREYSGFCHLSGILTEVGEMPTFDQWVTSSTMAPPPQTCDCSPGDPYASLRPDNVMKFSGDCPHPDCNMCKIRKGATELTVEKFYQGVQEVDGALQGQTAVGYSYLHFDYVEQDTPFNVGKVYKVYYKVYDALQNMWQVVRVEDVSDVPAKDLPEVFKQWEMGRDSADVAPYNLSEPERKEWAKRMEEERRVAEEAESCDDESED